MNADKTIQASFGPIKVTVPAGGTWEAGFTQVIDWTYTGNPATNVKIELYKNGVINSLITASTSISNWPYYWTVPANQPAGTDYRIKITSTTDSNIYGWSNEFSNIATTITVISPNGGESFSAGGGMLISWTHTGIPGNVKIELYKGGSFNRTIIDTSLGFITDSYGWLIPSGQTSGTDYKIKITSITPGLTNITDMSNNNFNINMFTVTPVPYANGSMTPSTVQTVNYNGTTSFTITPNAGYHIDSVSGCGGTLSGNTYTTGAISQNCIVSATFAINTYTVTPSAIGHGSMTPNTPQTVNYNSTKAFTITPDTGYHIASVSGCGGSLSGSIYTTGQITANCTVMATFAPNTYIVTPSSGLINGHFNPATPQTVNYGSQTTFAVIPDSGYQISTATGCNGTRNGSTYTTGPITADCTISATFSPCSILPVRIAGRSPDYLTLQSAFGDAADGATIQTQAVELIEPYVTSSKNVTVEGGYDCQYTTNTGGMTFLKGQLQTSGGTTRLRNFRMEK